MEKYEELRENSRKRIQIADHMLTMSYPMVKDSKLLLAALENIFLSLTNSIGALLHYERKYKMVPAFKDTFVSKFNIFRQKCVEKYKIDNETVLMIGEIRDMLIQHKKSPVEFARNDSLIICSDAYKLKAISPEKIKDYILKSKLFIQDINGIIDKNKAADSQKGGF